MLSGGERRDRPSGTSSSHPRRPLQLRSRFGRLSPCARPRRDGHGVSGPGPQARPAGRPQGPAPELAQALGRRALPARDRDRRPLNHPHILPLYDSGERRGAPLLRHALRGRANRSASGSPASASSPSRRRSAHRAARSGGALDYAHEQGRVHRDIKPENILLQDGQALVADFGIARAIVSGADERWPTEPAWRSGTPAYMSPEQASGDRMLDGRSDLYSLGCVVYEMLVGEPPFTGPSQQAILARHVLDPVPPLRSVRPAIPEHTERAVRRALGKVPADRFANSEDFAQALLTPGPQLAFQPTEVHRRTVRVAGRGRTVALGLGRPSFSRQGQVSWPRDETHPLHLIPTCSPSPRSTWWTRSSHSGAKGWWITSPRIWMAPANSAPPRPPWCSSAGRGTPTPARPRLWAAESAPESWSSATSRLLARIPCGCAPPFWMPPSRLRSPSSRGSIRWTGWLGWRIRSHCRCCGAWAGRHRRPAAPHSGGNPLHPRAQGIPQRGTSLPAGRLRLGRCALQTAPLPSIARSLWRCMPWDPTASGVVVCAGAISFSGPHSSITVSLRETAC